MDRSGFTSKLSGVFVTNHRSAKVGSEFADLPPKSVQEFLHAADGAVRPT